MAATMGVTFEQFVGERMWEVCGAVPPLDLQREKMEVLQAMTCGGISRVEFLEKFRGTLNLLDVDDAQVFDIWATYGLLTLKRYDFALHRWVLRDLPEVPKVEPAVVSGNDELVRKMEEMMVKQEERFSVKLAEMEAKVKEKGTGGEVEVPELTLEALEAFRKLEHKPSWMTALIILLEEHLKMDAEMQDDRPPYNLASNVWLLLYRNDKEYRLKYQRGQDGKKGVEIYSRDGKEYFRSRAGREIATGTRPFSPCNVCKENGHGSKHHWFFQCPLWS
jgi:hypothetical protein